MAVFEMTPIPLGSQLVYTNTLGENPVDRNDFRVRIDSDVDVTGLSLSGISISSDNEILSLSGENAVYEMSVRPQTTAAVITITIAADAVDQGNAETSVDIRLSEEIPDTDAETPTKLFDHTDTKSGLGITVTPSPCLGCV